jgi:hypothetical protein
MIGRPMRMLLCALWLLGSQPGLAQSPSGDSDARARHLYRNGELLYAEGLYSDAIAAWESAYELSDRPLLLYNMANAQERLGRWEDALQSLNRYRAFAPLEERDVLTRRIANIERNIDARRVQKPVPQVDPIVPERVAPAVRRRPPVRAEPARLDAQPPPQSSRLGRGPIGLFAVSGVGAVTGGVFAYRAKIARVAAADSCSGEVTIFCSTSSAAALQQDQVSSILADVGFGVALTSAVAGTLMAVTSKNTSNRTTMSLAPAVGGANLGLSSRF